MPNELTTVIQDTVHVVDTIYATAKSSGNSDSIAEVYKWIAGGSVVALSSLVIYIATTWRASLNALKQSFVILTENVSKLTEEIHMNRADEVAQRGLDSLRHENFERSLTGLEVRVETVEEDQITIR